jgi:hypothetical protein
MPAQALTGSPLAWVLRVLQVEEAPLEELTRILSQAVANVEERLANDEVEWHRFVLYLLLFIIHRRQAAERNELFNAVRETLTPRNREEVDEMIHSSAQEWLQEGRKEGRKEGQIKTLLEVMDFRFGSVPERVKKAVRALPSERLTEITRQIMQLQTLDELHLD